MRTTIRLPDNLLRQAKKLAADTNRSLTRVIEDALWETLSRSGSRNVRRTVRLKTFGRGGLRPGVNLDDGRTLRDLMDLEDLKAKEPDGSD